MFELRNRYATFCVKNVRSDAFRHLGRLNAMMTESSSECKGTINIRNVNDRIILEKRTDTANAKIIVALTHHFKP